ncbi:MAG: hypothetical protein P4L27_11655 [Ignavibacteriaceae bacterium]|nr:hypothetical protein [Ignavibacteriaceae bacterium]
MKLIKYYFVLALIFSANRVYPFSNTNLTDSLQELRFNIPDDFKIMGDVEINSNGTIICDGNNGSNASAYYPINNDKSRDFKVEADVVVEEFGECAKGGIPSFSIGIRGDGGEDYMSSGIELQILKTGDMKVCNSSNQANIFQSRRISNVKEVKSGNKFHMILSVSDLKYKASVLRFGSGGNISLEGSFIKDDDASGNRIYIRSFSCKIVAENIKIYKNPAIVVRNDGVNILPQLQWAEPWVVPALKNDYEAGNFVKENYGFEFKIEKSSKHCDFGIQIFSVNNIHLTKKTYLLKFEVRSNNVGTLYCNIQNGNNDFVFNTDKEFKLISGDIGSTCRYEFTPSHEADGNLTFKVGNFPSNTVLIVKNIKLIELE